MGLFNALRRVRKMVAPRSPRPKGNDDHAETRPRPREKEYHKKQRIGLRLDPYLLKEYKAMCEGKGISPSAAMELFILSLMNKKYELIVEKKLMKVAT